MNYPRVLMNPRLMPKPKKIHEDKYFLLNRLIDKKPKEDMYRPRKIGKWTTRPFTKFIKEKEFERRNAAYKKAMDKFGNKIST